ncbi:MAG TPA: GPP34 family phosphoprotein [Tenuifilaceae bacterium]|nr:GPP34 family phosphoprotein [Tenuifilaceae bacterium]HPJ45075.1 GPP34 family phosphoprotein [Tenuifilaceae bacterium]HRX67509.1 GPP34 family phosphoprotein [Tenuifilaceae bacterium]
MNLTIAEKFLVIAHHAEKGRFITSDVQMSYGLIGALILDLLLEKWFTIDNKLLILQNQKTSSNEVFEDMLSQIRREEKPKKIKRWITKFSYRTRKYKWTILSKLEEKKVVKIEHKKFLFIPYRQVFLLNQQVRKEILAALSQKILTSKKLSEEETSVLSLIEACKLHKTLSSDKTELRTIKMELKRLLKESPIADAVDATIKQVQAAIAASIAASAAASAATR